MSVAWGTYEPLIKACVRYGTSKDSLDSIVCSEAPPKSYPTSRTWFHDVTLTDLKPATKYFYEIISTNSTIVEFFSPRLAGDETPFTMGFAIDLGVMGDDGFTLAADVPASLSKREALSGVDPSMNHSTIQRLADTLDSYELINHPGDFAYADTWMGEAHNVYDGKNAYSAIIEQFYNQLSVVSARKPYMGSPGNHEAACFEIHLGTAFCPTGQRNFSDFSHRFSNMPKSFPSTSDNETARVLANKARQLANPPFWYSYDYGQVHVIMVDTETDFPDAPDQPGGSAGLDGGPFGDTPNQQLEFIKADLAAVDRSVTPWVIATGHRPLYTTKPDKNCEPCRLFFEPLFYQYGVDAVVVGHVHNSQRFLPVYNFTADPAGMKDPKAPMYIVAGGGGNVEGISPISGPPDGNFTAFMYDEHFSYASMTFHDKNTLQIDIWASSTGERVDSSTLFKSHKERFVDQSLP
ncbi:Acid phosphatase [Escovopsis weberi]|uniref:Purple acid phosphatase n=1 Tax=Escovopsis weberi TaxID=150374 RepID=A0A0M8N1P0_ESCWE|nr:Acid phosphatase [Escovopsis weberi]